MKIELKSGLMPEKSLQDSVLLQPLWLISETDMCALPHFPASKTHV